MPCSASSGPCLHSLRLCCSFPAARVLNTCWRHFAPSGTAQGCKELGVCVAGEVCPLPSSESCRKKLSSLCAGHCPCQDWQAHWVFRGSLVDKLLAHPAVLSVPWWNISAVWGTGEACLLSSSSGPWGLEFSPPNLGRWRKWSWPAPLPSCLPSSWRASAGTPGLCFQRCYPQLSCEQLCRSGSRGWTGLLEEKWTCWWLGGLVLLSSMWVFHSSAWALPGKSVVKSIPGLLFKVWTELRTQITLVTSHWSQAGKTTEH